MNNKDVKQELTISNFKQLLEHKDALVHTRKVTKRIEEKNILIGSDIFTITYSSKKGDVIFLFYNGKKLNLKKNTISAILATHGLKLDYNASYEEEDNKEKPAPKETRATLDDLSFLPKTTMLKEVNQKKKDFMIALAVLEGNEIRYVYDKKTKEVLKLEINGQEEEVSLETINKIKTKYIKKENEEKIIPVHLSDISFLQEHSLFKQINSNPNLQHGYSIIGKNIIRFIYNKETKEISDLVINNQPISLTEKNLKNLNIAIEAISKALKIKSNLYTIDDIYGLEDNSTIRRIDDNKLEGFAFYGDEIVIRYIYDKNTRLLNELEINDKIVPINVHTIKYLNTNISEFLKTVPEENRSMK